MLFYCIRWVSLYQPLFASHHYLRLGPCKALVCSRSSDNTPLRSIDWINFQQDINIGLLQLFLRRLVSRTCSIRASTCSISHSPVFCTSTCSISHPPVFRISTCNIWHPPAFRSILCNRPTALAKTSTRVILCRSPLLYMYMDDNVQWRVQQKQSDILECTSSDAGIHIGGTLSVH